MSSVKIAKRQERGLLHFRWPPKHALITANVQNDNGWKSSIYVSKLTIQLITSIGAPVQVPMFCVLLSFCFWISFLRALSSQVLTELNWNKKNVAQENTLSSLIKFPVYSRNQWEYNDLCLIKILSTIIPIAVFDWGLSFQRVLAIAPAVLNTAKKLQNWLKTLHAI